jgi:hypothetical protein
VIIYCEKQSAIVHQDTHMQDEDGRRQISKAAKSDTALICYTQESTATE